MKNWTVLKSDLLITSYAPCPADRVTAEILQSRLQVMCAFIEEMSKNVDVY